MYNLIEYSSNYSETTWSLWFYLKDEATNFDAIIASNNDFNYFEYKAKLLENIGDQPNPNETNGILKNARITVPLKYLNHFWRSLKMPLIICKVELKLKWTKYCVLSASGNDNDNIAKKIFLLLKAKKMSVVTLSARDNQKLSNILNKRLERLGYWNEYKTKSKNKNTTIRYRYFLERYRYFLVGVNRLSVLVYSNQDVDCKRFKTWRYYLPKSIIKNYNVIVNGKNVYDQCIDSDI